MEISSNCFGLFTEFTMWVEIEKGSVPVELKRPVRAVGEHKEPDDNELIISVIRYEIDFFDGELTKEDELMVINFVRNEIKEGRLKFPVSLEFSTKNFKDEKYFDIV